MFWIYFNFIYLFCYFNIPATATVKTPPMSEAFRKLQADEVLTVTKNMMRLEKQRDVTGKMTGVHYNRGDLVR